MDGRERRRFGERDEPAARPRAAAHAAPEQHVPPPPPSPAAFRPVDPDARPPLGEIRGRVAPTLELSVGEGEEIAFDPQLVLWKDPAVSVSMRTEGGVAGTLGGMLRRAVAGSSAVLARASGKGRICLSRGEPGAVMAVEMSRGDRVQVREGAFLACTDGITCDFERNSGGVGNVLFGGSGMFLGVFEATRHGVLYLHALGDAHTVELLRSEGLDVVTHGWLWKDASVDMSLVGAGLANAVMGVGSLVMHRFTGPGRVAVQSGRIREQKAKE